MFVLIFGRHFLSQKGIIEFEGGGKMYSTYQIRIKKGNKDKFLSENGEQQREKDG